MNRKQLIITYAVIIFMMIWGLDLIAAVKFNSKIQWSDAFTIFTLSQLIYITATMLLTMVVLRRIFNSRRYVLLIPAIAGLIFFFIFLRYSLEEILYPIIFQASNYNPNTTFRYYLLDNVYYAIIYIVLGFLVFLLDNQFRNQKKQAELLRERNVAELQFLRSQVNPHFLFNTLNNIYSLVYEKSDKAPVATLQLAELMRYTLYEKKEQVPISQEWKYIQSFIELQQLRFEKDVALQQLTEGNLEGVEIAPYLLIAFVENAFKHGDVTDPAFPLTIKLVAGGQQIDFQITNKIANYQKDKTGGVGLENVKKRLGLIYQDRYKLDYGINDNIFKVHLTIHRG